MKRYHRPITLFVLALAVFAADLDADPVWRQAVELYNDGTAWVAGRMQIESHEYDGRGNTRNTESSVYTLRHSGDEVEAEIVSVVRNGHDITSERRENPEYQSGRSFEGTFDGFGRSPLDRDAQDSVSIEYAGTDVLNGAATLLYRYRLIDDGNTTVGTVWIEPDSRTPVRISTQPEPLPRFVDSIEITQDFGKTETGEPVVSRVLIDANGRFLLIRRRFVVELAFAEYSPRVDGR